MRKSTLTSLCFLLSLILLAIPGLAQHSAKIWTGVPIYFATLTLHVNGQPINVYKFVVSIYPMNTPPPWPIGLWLYYYVEADPGGSDNDKSSWGQGSWCRWWFYEVAAVEQQNPKHVPYPFFEINLPTDGTPLQTDEQIPVYPAGSVTCWQADNDYAP
jgi:hypothetical protein